MALAERPDVIVEFTLDGPLLMLTVRNLGGGCAHRVRVRFRPSFRGAGGAVDMTGIALFGRLAFLGPGSAISAFVDVADHYFARGEPEVMACVVKFRDDAGRGFTRRICHDLGIYRDLPRHARPSDR